MKPFYHLVNLSQPITIQGNGPNTVETVAIVVEFGKSFPVSGQEVKVHSVRVDAKFGWVKLEKPVEVMLKTGTIATTQVWSGDPPG